MADLCKYIQDTTKLIIPILTFQSALHATSIIFFANSNAKVFQDFKNDYINKNGVKTKYRKIDQLYVYFSWAILIQLFFLMYAIILIAYLSSHNQNYFITDILVFDLYLLVFGVVYSVILCMRNVGLFFSALVINKKNVD